jgi:hypothetical protein
MATKAVLEQPTATSAVTRDASIREIDNGYLLNITMYGGTSPSVRQELAFTSVNKTAAMRKALRIIAAFFNAETE